MPNTPTNRRPNFNPAAGPCSGLQAVHVLGRTRLPSLPTKARLSTSLPREFSTLELVISNSTNLLRNEFYKTDIEVIYSWNFVN
jgi:hypothetical protein